MNYCVRQATIEEAHHLPLIEFSAAQAFRQFSKTVWIADAQAMPVEKYLPYIISGHCWVAVNNQDKIVGFANITPHNYTLHLDEIAVDIAFQNQGIGTQLLRQCEAFAVAKNYSAVTLLTFIDIPWNMPWYLKQGYRLIEEHEQTVELSALIERENSYGLCRDIRCAMIKQILN